MEIFPFNLKAGEGQQFRLVFRCMPKLIPRSEPDKQMDHHGRPAVRILVVEDHESFRRYYCSTLEQRADFQVIGQASDGLEAIQKAQELQPDLILLDVGLPKLNGLEAAKKMRTAL